jgi:hypothetical protein
MGTNRSYQAAQKPSGTLYTIRRASRSFQCLSAPRRARIAVAPTLAALRFNVTDSSSSISSEANKLYDQMDETYTLDIGAIYATLAANTSLGILRGLQTFVQLVYTLEESEGPATLYLRNAPHHIRDRPAFPHRCAAWISLETMHSVTVLSSKENAAADSCSTRRATFTRSPHSTRCSTPCPPSK